MCNFEFWGFEVYVGYVVGIAYVVCDIYGWSWRGVCWVGCCVLYGYVWCWYGEVIKDLWLGWCVCYCCGVGNVALCGVGVLLWTCIIMMRRVITMVWA